MNAGVTSSKYLEGLGDRGDFPVHNKPCLWIKVENLGLISIGTRRRESHRLWFDVNSVHSFAQSCEQLIRNRSRHMRNLLRSQRVSIMRAIEQDFSANACAGNVRQINLHLVHADSSDDRRSAPFNQHLTRTGKLPRKPIIITKRHNANFGAALRSESSVVPQSIARRKFLNAGNAAGESHGKFQVNHFARGLRRINSVESQANAHHVVMRFRKTDRAGGVGGMNLKFVKAVCLKPGNNLVESRNLLAREVVRSRIFSGGKVRADSSKSHHAAGANALRDRKSTRL